MSNNINWWVEKKYLLMKRKYFVSQFWFYLLNITAFAIAASIVVLNLFALRMNKIETSKPFFLGMAIIGAVITFVTTLISFFAFKNKANLAKEKLERIAEESKKFKTKQDEYKGKDAEHILVKRITFIFNADDLD